MQARMKIAAAIIGVSLYAGSAIPQSAAPATGDTVPNPSGFLEDYSKLKPTPGREGRYSWTVPNAELAPYNKFLLPPMEVWIDRDAQYRGFAADVTQRLAAAYQSGFRLALAPEFSVVDQPGPGVATCRFAVTGLTPEKPGMTAVDVLPIKAVFNIVRSATGTASRVARISAEIECHDSVNKRLLIQAVVSGVGTRKFSENEPIPWADVEPVLRGWGEDFKQRLIAAQGR
jgi:hypothetical protein